MRAAALFFRLGCLHAGLAVVIGAFGAHGVADTLENNNMTHVYETGVQYQFYHVPPHFVIAWLLSLAGPHTAWCSLCVAGAMFSLGTVLFSGSLYALALTNIDALGVITPFGGLLYIAGWMLLMCRGPDILGVRAGESAADGLLTVQR